MIDWNSEKAAAFLAEPRVRKMIEECPENKLVADFGCYTGDIAQQLVLKKNKVHGYDCNSTFVEMTAKKGIPSDVVDFESELDIPNKVFDVIVAGELIEHVYKTELFLKECHRVLKNDGELIISTPNLMFWKHRIKMLFGIQAPIFGYDSGMEDNNPGHCRYYSFKSLEEHLILHGFKITKCRGSYVFSGALGEWLADIFPTFAYHLIIKAKKIPF